jgi:hypothetical protein
VVVAVVVVLLLLVRTFSTAHKFALSCLAICQLSTANSWGVGRARKDQSNAVNTADLKAGEVAMATVTAAPSHSFCS